MPPHQPSRRSVLALLGAAPVAAGAALTATSAAQADPSGSDRIPRDLLPGGAFDQYVARLAAEDKFSGTVLLVQRNRPVLARSHRMADKQLSIPNGPDTIFALGSITKVFTGVAIAQLAQQGKVDYHETLGTYLDRFPAEIARVTIHQLLTHTAGLGNYLATDAYKLESGRWNSAAEVMDGITAIIRQSPLIFPPGTDHKYSNSGYHVLGAIVASVAGQSYFDYVRARIFRPTRMHSADFYTRPQWRDDRRIAHPYTTQPSGERVDAIDGRVFMGGPAGGAFANAADLVRFANAVQGNELLNLAYSHLVLSPKLPVGYFTDSPDVPRRLTFTTYAPTTKLVGNQWVLGHNGGAPGVSANLDWFPATDWVAVVLANYDAGTTSPIAGMARELIAGQQPTR